MKKFLLFIVLMWAYDLSAQTTVKVDITTKNEHEREKATMTLVKETLETYDLGRWVFTNKIVIEDRVIPHSHPVLTLSTGYRDKKEVAATFIHEQLHWYLEKNEDKLEKAIAEFKKKYKNVPYNNRAGAQDEYSTYMHLVNCYLEYRGLASLIGEEDAKQMMWNKSYYTWVYNKIIEDRDYVGKVVADAGFDLAK